jgi:hypothetical protein
LNPTTTLLNKVDELECRNEILETGYAVRHNLVSTEDIAAVRDHWLEAFSTSTERRPMIWGPYYGEQNRVIQARAKGHVLFRSFDFLWNAPLDPLTRNLGIQLSRLRNRIAQHDERRGEYISEDNYGLYITTSLYPKNLGWMEEHRDEVPPGERHWHFILPITFKGEDYDAGGLFITDRNEKRIDIDSALRRGSVVFFDGARPHGVDKIRSSINGVGRLQMFTIPVFFELPHRQDRVLEQISAKRFIKSRLRQFLRGHAG